MTTDARIDALEKQLAELAERLHRLEKPKDWRNMIGAFAGDDVMKQIFAEGQRIREAERRRARRLPKKRPARSKK